MRFHSNVCCMNTRRTFFNVECLCVALESIERMKVPLASNSVPELSLQQMTHSRNTSHKQKPFASFYSIISHRMRIICKSYEHVKSVRSLQRLMEQLFTMFAMICKTILSDKSILNSQMSFIQFMICINPFRKWFSFANDFEYLSIFILLIKWICISM